MSRLGLRRLVVSVAAAVALAGMAYGLYWIRLADATKDGIAAWQSARRAEGWAVSHEGIDVAGFPFRLRVAVASPRIRTPDGAGWKAAALEATASPFAPRRVRLVPAGRQEVEVPVAGSVTTVWLDAVTAEGHLQLPSEGGTRATAHLASAALGLPGGDRVTIASLDVALDLPPKPSAGSHTATAAVVSLVAGDIVLPAPADTPLGRRVASVALRGRLQGDLTLDRPVADALARWRDEGGVAEIDDLSVAWEHLDVRMEGALALDAGLQPMAAMTGMLRGYSETVDTFVRSGLVRPADGRAVKLVLALMARTPAAGGPPQITVPLTIQDGVFHVGPVALMKVPPIAWPTGQSSAPK